MHDVAVNHELIANPERQPACTYTSRPSAAHRLAAQGKASQQRKSDLALAPHGQHTRASLRKQLADGAAAAAHEWQGRRVEIMA
jgi:hypothetical protein